MEQDVVSIEYLENSARFADFLNVILYGGKQIIRSEDVIEADSTYHRIEKKKTIDKNGKVLENRKIKKNTADMVKKVVCDLCTTVWAIEEQTHIHYAMPVRTLNLEASVYNTQWRNFAKKYQNETTDHYDCIVLWKTEVGWPVLPKGYAGYGALPRRNPAVRK